MKGDPVENGLPGGEYTVCSSSSIAPDSTLRELCTDLLALQSHASELGLFAEMRGILMCPTCGLHEDVLIDGSLITYQGVPDKLVDSGLRFTESDDGRFICPQCSESVNHFGVGT